MGAYGVIVSEKKAANSYSKVTVLKDTFQVEVANGHGVATGTVPSTEAAPQWDRVCPTDVELLNAEIDRLGTIAKIKPEALAGLRI